MPWNSNLSSIETPSGVGLPNDPNWFLQNRVTRDTVMALSFNTLSPSVHPHVQSGTWNLWDSSARISNQYGNQQAIWNQWLVVLKKKIEEAEVELNQMAPELQDDTQPIMITTGGQGLKWDKRRVTPELSESEKGDTEQEIKDAEESGVQEHIADVE